MRRLLTRSRQRGAAAVEFALVMPLFAAILFGIMEYGWVFYQQFNVAAAVRDGLRVGVTVSQTATPDPRSSAQSRTQADLDVAHIAGATITPLYSGSSPTKLLTLTVVAPYHPLIGLVPTPAHLRYSMTMMLELQ